MAVLGAASECAGDEQRDLQAGGLWLQHRGPLLLPPSWYLLLTANQCSWSEISPIQILQLNIRKFGPGSLLWTWMVETNWQFLRPKMFSKPHSYIFPGIGHDFLMKFIKLNTFFREISKFSVINWKIQILLRGWHFMVRDKIAQVPDPDPLHRCIHSFQYTWVWVSAWNSSIRPCSQWGGSDPTFFGSGSCFSCSKGS